MAKVMLVEDDNNLREIYEARLAAEGYEIVSAHDGEEALALAVKERPDLIISDVMMPKVSGFDMLDILRSTPETRDTKVIMMTALSQAEDRARADKLGADRYLVKSQVTLEDVVKVAHEVLEGSSAPVAPTPTDTPTTEPVTTPLATPPEPTVPVVAVPVAEPPTEDSTAPSADDTTSEPAADTAVVAGIPVITPPEEPDEPAVSDPAPTPVVDGSVTPEPTSEEVPAPAEKPETVTEPTETPTEPAVEPEKPSETEVVTPESDKTPEEPTAVADPIPSTNAEQQIQDFLANSAATSAPATEPTQNTATAIPVSMPDNEPSEDTVDANQTEPSKQRKIIQPTGEIATPAVDLNALLAKEEQSASNQPSITPSVINPTTNLQSSDSPVDPNSIAL